MAVTIILIACFVLYGASKYFPYHGGLWGLLRHHQVFTRILGAGLLLLALLVMQSQHGVVNAVVFWCLAIMLAMSLLVVSLRFHKAWLLLWVGIGFVFMFIEYTL